MSKQDTHNTQAGGQDEQMQNYEQQVKNYEEFFPKIIKRLENIIPCDELLVKFIVNCAGVCNLTKEKLASQISQFFEIDNKENEVEPFAEWCVKEIKLFEQQKFNNRKKSEDNNTNKDKRDRVAMNMVKNAVNQAQKNEKTSQHKSNDQQDNEKLGILDRLKKPQNRANINNEQDNVLKKVKQEKNETNNIEQEEGGKIQKRCTFWPNCKNGESCKYVHPHETCKDFPKCKLGKRCMFIHPAIECKFAMYCKRKDCSYIHPKMNFNPYMMSMMKNPFTKGGHPYMGPKKFPSKFHKHESKQVQPTPTPTPEVKHEEPHPEPEI